MKDKVKKSQKEIELELDLSGKITPKVTSITEEIEWHNMQGNKPCRPIKAHWWNLRKNALECIEKDIDGYYHKIIKKDKKIK